MVEGKAIVFFTLDSLQVGGAERSTLEITRRLPNHIKPIVVFFYDRSDLRSEFLDANIDVISIGLKRRYDFREGIRRFTELCVQQKPDLIVASLYRAEFISRIVGRTCRVPVIGTFVNDTYSKYEINSLNFAMKLKVAFFWLLNKYTSRFCFRFLANSESIKKSNASALFINHNLIDVIPRGREISKYTFSGKRFQNNKTVFLNVGRLIPRKGQYELIEAFSITSRKYPNIELWIAGDGSFKSELSKLIERLNLTKQVKLLGNVNNVPELLHKADVFIFPSWYEGFSGAIVEAMLAGTPILASNIDMNKEAVTHNESAFLFKVKDVESICGAIEFAVNNKETMQKFAMKARSKAEKQYDINLIAQKHATYYSRIIHENSPNPSATSV